MVSSNEFIEAVIEAYQRMRTHKYPYTFNTTTLAGSPSASGLEIVIFPEVYSPKYFTDSDWFGAVVPCIVGKKSFLEIGTGTGIVALQVAINQEEFGRAHVTATDINPRAVANARHNFERYGVNALVLESDMYNVFTTLNKFDFIFWNHPFNCADAPTRDMLMRAGFDYKYKDLEKYIAGAQAKLTENGALLLGTSVYADIRKVEELAQRHGYRMELLNSTQLPLTHQGKLMTEYRIYALRGGQQ